MYVHIYAHIYTYMYFIALFTVNAVLQSSHDKFLAETWSLLLTSAFKMLEMKMFILSPTRKSYSQEAG